METYSWKDIEVLMVNHDLTMSYGLTDQIFFNGWISYTDIITFYNNSKFQNSKENIYL